MNFHQKLVVYYILDYFGILFILDINSVLIEFILCDQRLLKGFVLKNILRDKGTVKLYFLSELHYGICSKVYQFIYTLVTEHFEYS